VNADQFLALLAIGSDSDGRIVLPVADPAGDRVFGGQMLAQLIWAAAQGSGKAMKSLHVAFPREGRPADPLFLDLETAHDGRSVGLRRAVIWQHGSPTRRTVAIATILLDQADPDPDHRLDAPPGGDPATGTEICFAVVPGQVRLASATGLDDDRAQPAEFSFWMRCDGIAGATQAHALVAYVSDWPVIGTLLKAVPGVSERDAHKRLQTGVLTHSVWFHQPFDATDWLRVDVRGRRLGGGRGFGTGDVYTLAGSLVASFAQESIIRQPPG
jgi:acyl-CoA thioesterase II